MPKNGESVLALAGKAEELNKVAGKPAPGLLLSQCLLLADDKKTSVVVLSESANYSIMIVPPTT